MADRPVQTYANHVHQPRLTAIAGVLCLLALVLLGIELFRRPSLISLALVLLTLSVFVLVLISRDYTVRLQDRIIRVEMQRRLERLGRGPDFLRLTMPQVAALRYASDSELPSLIDRALTERLSGDQIKRAITDWQPDFFRT